MASRLSSLIRDGARRSIGRPAFSGGSSGGRSGGPFGGSSGGRSGGPFGGSSGGRSGGSSGVRSGGPSGVPSGSSTGGPAGGDTEISLLTGSMLVRFGKNVLYRLKLIGDTRTHLDDILDENLSLVDPKKNFIFMNKGKEIGSLSLSQTRIDPFNTPKLPSPSDFKKAADNSHYVQAVLCPSQKFGWVDLHDKNKSGKNFKFSTMIRVTVEVVKGSDQEAKGPGLLLYDGVVGQDVAAILKSATNAYKLKPNEKIGEFKQAKVFKGESAVSGTDVLLKEFKYQVPEAYGQPREAYLLKQLKHDALRAVHAAWTRDDGKQVAALDYLKRTLEDYLNEKKVFDLVERKLIFTQILSGLKEIHDHKIVHLDLAPSNILLNEDVKAFICDLGIGTLTQNGRFPFPENKFFSSEYCAPELTQPHGLDRTFKVDIFSLGLIYFMLLSLLDDWEKDVLKFRQYVLDSDFKSKDHEAKVELFSKSEFFKKFHGDAGLLIWMVDSKADRRPDCSQIKTRMGKKGMGQRH